MKGLSVYVDCHSKKRFSWHFLAQSLTETTSMPLSIKPVNLKIIAKCKRNHRAHQPKEFSFLRFLVPYLKEIDGFSFFNYKELDRIDIKDFFYIASCIPDTVVHIVKQNYNPENDINYLGQKQYSYSLKSWWSLVISNCSHPKYQALLLDFINNATNTEPHRFTWLTDEEICNLDLSWKWLVGEYVTKALIEPVKNLHWTAGEPYFKEYSNADFCIRNHSVENSILNAMN